MGRKKRTRGASSETTPVFETHDTSSGSAGEAAGPASVFPRLPAWLCLLAILLASTLYALHFHAHDYKVWEDQKDRTYYQGEPLLGNLDGYYFLRLARDLAENDYKAQDDRRSAPRPFPAPLLSRLAAWSHAATGWPLAEIAYYLPPILAWCMVFLYIPWGRALGGWRFSAMAALAGTSSLYWHDRTNLGRFDTDCLTPLFLLFIAWLSWRMSESHGARRIGLLAVLAGGLALFGLWWKFGLLLGLGIAVGGWCLSGFLPRLTHQGRLERWLKFAVLGLGILIVAATAMGLHEHVPTPISGYMEVAHDHLSLVRKESDSPFPEVGQSIDELQTVDFVRLGSELGGHWTVLLLSCIGLAGAAVLRPRAALFLLPVFAVGLMSIVSQRFLVMATPVYALGLAFFFGGLLGHPWLTRFFRIRVLQASLAWALFLAALVPGATAITDNDRAHPIQSSHAILADAAKARSGPDAVIWNWWDFGYFYQYQADRKTMSDGGLQGPERTFAISFALGCPNPNVARRWIKFFAAHDTGGWRKVLDAVQGDHHKAHTLLQEVFYRPEQAHDILMRYGLTDTEWWTTFLFPEKEAVLVLTTDLFEIAYWWYLFGSWDFEKRVGTEPRIEKIPMSALPEDLESGVIPYHGEPFPLHRLVRISPKGREFRDLNSRAAATLVTIHSVDDALLMDERVYNSLVSRLLLRNPLHTTGFKPIYYHALVGGVWKVE